MAHWVGRRGGNFLDAVQDLRPSRVCIDDLPYETSMKASRCTLELLQACGFSCGSGALILSMTSLAAEAAPHWLPARLFPVVPRQAAIAAPLYAGVDWASLLDGALTSFHWLPPAVCGRVIHFVASALHHDRGIRRRENRLLAVRRIGRRN